MVEPRGEGINEPIPTEIRHFLALLRLSVYQPCVTEQGAKFFGVKDVGIRVEAQTRFQLKQ